MGAWVRGCVLEWLRGAFGGRRFVITGPALPPTTPNCTGAIDCRRDDEVPERLARRLLLEAVDDPRRLLLRNWNRKAPAHM